MPQRKGGEVEKETLPSNPAERAKRGGEEGGGRTRPKPRKARGEQGQVQRTQPPAPVATDVWRMVDLWEELGLRRCFGVGMHRGRYK